MADTPLELGNRKLVVLGIPWHVNTEGLKQYMSKYGSLDDVVVMKDRKSGRSRGFGYVTFSSAESAEKALASKHILHERLLEVKVATPKEDMKVPAKKITRIFVARIPHKVSEEAFKEYFESFGVITDLYMPKDQGAKTHRGIGFITFENPESVAKVMAETHEIGGSTVAVDEASPKDEGGKTFNAKSNYPMKSSYSDRERDYRGAYGSYSPYMDTNAGGSRFGAYGLSSYGAYDYPESHFGSDFGPSGLGGGGYGGSSWSGPPFNSGGAFNSRSASYSSGGPEPPSSVSTRNRIFVGRLPSEVTTEDLRRYFGNFGRILDVFVPKDSGRHRGFAFVTFSDQGPAERVSQRSHELLGHQITVERDSSTSLGDTHLGAGGSGMYGGTGSSAYSGSSIRSSLDHYNTWGGAYSGVGPTVGADRFSRTDARYRPY